MLKRGFVKNDETVLRIMYSPKQYSIKDSVVLMRAYSPSYFREMSVDRQKLIDPNTYPDHVKEVSKIKRDRAPKLGLLAQAVVGAVAGDLRGLKEYEDDLFICPSSRDEWPPHAEICFNKHLDEADQLEFMGTMYNIFSPVNMGIKFPL